MNENFEKQEDLWTSKKGILSRYEGMNYSTLSHWLTEMRSYKEFRKYVVNPTPKLVWINVQGFHEFLQFKQKNNYR